ncbi:MAG: nucleoside triphosphate pyrophosphohydrolase [Pseudomonadota bacterium]
MPEGTNRPREAEGEALQRVVELVRRLRAPGGCPWDREQTPLTIKGYLIEEAYELLEAIEQADPAGVKEELGDVSFQIVFLAELYREAGAFGLADALQTSLAKMTGRHPHVFGQAEVLSSAAEVVDRWQQIKKTQEGKPLLGSVPRGLPSLLRAHRLGQRAAGVGFDFPSPEAAAAKLAEEVFELKAAMAAGDAAQMRLELGDVLFACVNVARLLKLSAEDALKDSLDKFTARFERIEKELAAQGKTPREATLAEMDAIWDEMRKAE